MTFKTRRLALSGAICAALVAGVVLFRAQHSTSTGSPSQYSRVVAEPQRERGNDISSSTAPLEESIAQEPYSAEERQLVVPSAPRDERSPVARDAEEPARLDELQHRGRPGEPIRELRAAEREFAAQNRDPLWSTAMESRILSEISLTAATGSGYSSLEVDCRAMLCRVQLTNESVSAPAEAESSGQPSAIFTVAEALELEFRLAIAAVDGYGTPITVVFLNRNEGAD